MKKKSVEVLITAGNCKAVIIKEGERRRVIVYLDGRKYYLEMDLYSYKLAHGRDLKKKSKAEKSARKSSKSN